MKTGKHIGKHDKFCVNMKVSDPERTISRKLEMLKRIFSGISTPDLYKMIVSLGVHTLIENSESLKINEEQLQAQIEADKKQMRLPL